MKKASPHLERPIPDGQRAEWARMLAARPTGCDLESHESFYVVRLGEEWFGLPPAILAATLPLVQPRRLPHRTRGFVEGLINWDGRLVVCLSLERLLGGPAASAPEGAGRLLIVHWKGWACALRVHFVLGVETLDVSLLQPLPASAAEALKGSARGIVRHRNRSVVCFEKDVFVEQLRKGFGLR